MPNVEEIQCGYNYASIVLENWKIQSLAFLFDAIDVYKQIAQRDNDSFAFGIAEWIWEQILEREVVA
jgi:hypothetical protein